MVTFGLIWKTAHFKQKLPQLLLDHFWKKNGLILFLDLVTLFDKQLRALVVS